MLIYKFVDNEGKILAAREADKFLYVRYIALDDRVILCDRKDLAFGVRINGKVYSLGKDINNYPKGLLIPIDLVEYKELSKVLSKADIFSSDSIDLNIDNNDSAADLIYKTLYEYKIFQLSKDCNNAIKNGIDINYSESMTKHFDLTIEDQLNLNALRYQLITSDQDTFAYHSKNDDFEYYNRKEVEYIIASVDKHILYHTAYFNSLKKYVNSLTSADEINNIEYGQDFPDMYKSQVLLEISDK